METVIVAIVLSIIAATCVWLNFLKGKKNSIKKEVVHRLAHPKFSVVPSCPDDEREKEVDRLLKKRNLSLAEQQYIYDYLIETGKEKWRYIKGYEGFYRINTYGVIESCRYGRLITPSLRKNGAFSVGLCVGTIHKGYSVHQLVAETFIPNPNHSLTVKPKDGNYSNCDVRNLMWRKGVTPSKVAAAA